MAKTKDQKTNILIIGAGPAGLAIAGRLRKLGIDFTILEKDNVVGAMWHKHYDRLCLHTVKQLSHLPHLPFPDDFPTYIPKEQLAKYYQDYARHFKIQPHFDTEIVKIERQNSAWKMMTKVGSTITAKQVIIATGANRVPYRPEIAGQHDYSGIIMHSRDYKSPQPFVGKRVLVIGMGNTGAEIALDLAEQEIENYLSVRSPVNIVPRDVFGKPAQLTAKMLEKLPFNLGKIISKVSTRLIIGDLTKFGLQHSRMHPVDQLKQTGQTPVIDLGTVDQIKKGKIKVMDEIDHFNPDGVSFKSGRQVQVDAVIFATGYRTGIENILENTEGLFDKHGLPKDCIGTGDYRDLYFLGFDNYKLGGLLGTIYIDSEKIAQVLSKLVL
ncbi:MAG: NAD(P)/FAD-dependent oxidoreductase [Saprospiraceae bacterium]|nr:NAD(P)/FAD-dependent oxidoreductase [Saprospiraceae bacterium]